MPRPRKLTLLEQAEAQAKKERNEAFEAAVKANPELYSSLKHAVFDAKNAYRELDEKYRVLNQARYDASGLSQKLADSGFSTEANMVNNVLALIEEAITPLLEPYRTATDAYEFAEKALKEHFPDDDI